MDKIPGDWIMNPDAYYRWMKRLVLTGATLKRGLVEYREDPSDIGGLQKAAYSYPTFFLLLISDK